LASDRSLAPDIEAMQRMVMAGDIAHAIEARVPELQALRLA
jgi:hypothetical protein